ncbi:hypothetical protein H6G45_14610 [Synechocystis sp. FACHB-383]|uniref:hypothetical protein n=1 Tax=Synechocystis sp. FACHB-383 TaxID=2692864 RepID=UPI001683A21D|nr:hypothetical protein [Synechocystis sp. FACHB-383]MBD2654690.1 hypothetical protein [Synechocystis sp. FACHB-383]
MNIRDIGAFLVATVMLGQGGSVGAEVHWIVRPLVDSANNTVSCLGLYQNYSHQLTKDQLILFIPGEFEQIELELSYGDAKPTLSLAVGEKSTFGVAINGEIFAKLLQAEQLTIKGHQASPTTRESGAELIIESLNLAGMAEAVAVLQGETCATGEIYQFPAPYFLRYEDPIAPDLVPQPMNVPNWDKPPSGPRNNNIQFPRPSRQGLPDTTGGGGTRAIDDNNNDNPDSPF